MSEYQPIDCGDYDFLEIACMDGYDLQVETAGGLLQGKAQTLEISGGEEFLRLRDTAGDLLSVRIDRIRAITVTSHPRRFDCHEFAGVCG